jgi:hypothetical protein
MLQHTKNCVMSVRWQIKRIARFLKRYTAVFVDINGAPEGRNFELTFCGFVSVGERAAASKIVASLDGG